MYPVPDGAHYCYREIWYRVGRHGFVFRWSDQLREWVKSNLTYSEISEGMTPGELWDKINMGGTRGRK